MTSHKLTMGMLVKKAHGEHLHLAEKVVSYAHESGS